MTSIEPLPENVSKFLTCRLLHKKRPVLTGKIIWDEKSKKALHEMKWVCDICDSQEKQHNP